MQTARVLTLLVLLVKTVNSFPWDIVVGEGKRLEFYYNGTLTHTEHIPSANPITSVTYDPVHYRLLFASYNDPNMTISSFDLSTRNIQPLVTRESDYYARAVYDPVTQLLFWTQHPILIHSFSLNPASSNKAVDGNVLLTLEHPCYDLAVDICGGYVTNDIITHTLTKLAAHKRDRFFMCRYIYWITDYEVEMARFDGSEREVLIDSHVYGRRSLAIDQQTQKLYWMETILVNSKYQLSIESANFNGKNRTTLHIIGNVQYGSSLAVSKDFIYWKNYDQVGIWQLPKITSQHVEGKLFSMFSSDFVWCHLIATNYTIKEQIQGTKSCKALQTLIPNDSKPESTVSTCQNYCFQGDCSVGAEGQPTCSCKAGYSGERCEVNACHKHCLNNGVCSLNEEDDAVCECTTDYEGARCEVATTCSGVHAENTTPQVLPDLRKEVRQVIKEELKRMLQFFSDKIAEYQAKI